MCVYRPSAGVLVHFICMFPALPPSRMEFWTEKERLLMGYASSGAWEGG